MMRKIKILVAMFMLSIGALACQAFAGGETPEEDSPVASVLLNDDFSVEQWGTGTDADSAVGYVDGALQMILFTRNWFVWSTPDDTEYSDIHMEVTVINNNTDSTTAFGLICNKTSDSDFYYAAMTPAGQYAIARAADGETDFFLTNNDQWGGSDLIPVDAASYRVGMDCGNGRFTLYVNGQRIASADDPIYTSGQVAVFAWSGEEAVTTNVSFDDFLMTPLP